MWSSSCVAGAASCCRCGGGAEALRLKCEIAGPAALLTNSCPALPFSLLANPGFAGLGADGTIDPRGVRRAQSGLRHAGPARPHGARETPNKLPPPVPGGCGALPRGLERLWWFPGDFRRSAATHLRRNDGREPNVSLVARGGVSENPQRMTAPWGPANFGHVP